MTARRQAGGVRTLGAPLRGRSPARPVAMDPGRGYLVPNGTVELVQISRP
ncbi:hypothetical protein [Dactylosporangium sp. NPDC049140]